MKLQLALDYMDLPRSLTAAKAAAPWVDWIEAGTSLVKLAGMDAVSTLRAEFLHHVIVADMKTADGGRRETNMAFAAGADVSTVLGLVPDKSITECLETAREAGKILFVDLLGCAPDRAAQVQRLGATHVIYHIGKDEQGERSLSFDVLRHLKQHGLIVAVAGGIKAGSLAGLRAAGADVAIIGSAITGAPDPTAAARAFRAELEEV